MRILLGILISIIILAIGMFAFWIWALKHSADILEFHHPSRSIGHSIEKKVFIDTMYIIDPDTIRTDDNGRIDIVPKSAWIEKMVYWKSGMIDLDSIGFLSDTVVLVVNFDNFVNGRPWNQKDSGFYIGDFRDHQGNEVSAYVGEHVTRLSFKMTNDQATDTIRVRTENNEQIILTKNNN